MANTTPSEQPTRPVIRLIDLFDQLEAQGLLTRLYQASAPPAVPVLLGLAADAPLPGPRPADSCYRGHGQALPRDVDFGVPGTAANGAASELGHQL